MAFTEALKLLIDADTRGAVHGIERLGATADRELGRSEKNLDRWGATLTKTGAGMVAFGAAALVGLGMAAESAGELEQAVGGTEAVFKDARGEIDRFAKDSADKLGLSERAFRELTTTSGAMLKNLGMSTEDAAKQAVKLTQTGADLAATYGGTTKDAVEALGAALRGEADPAERFGLRLSQSAVNAKAVELGLAASESAVSDYAKAQATLALITEQSADAQGRFAAESDTLQGRQQRLAASFENLKAAIGQGALPVFETFADVAGTGSKALLTFNEASGGTAGKIAAFGAVGLVAAGGLNIVIGTAIQARSSLLALRSAAAVAAGPAGLGALAVVLAGLAEINNQRQISNNIEKLSAEFLAAGTNAEKMQAALQKAAELGPGELIGLFQDLAETNHEAAERFIEQAEAAGASGRALSEMRAALETTTAAQAQTAEDTEAAAGSFDDAAASAQSYGDTLKALFDPLFGAIRAQRELEDANAEVTAAEMELAAAIRDYGADSFEAMAATDRLRDAQFRATEAAVTQAGSIDGLRRGLQDGSIDINTARERLDEFVRSGQISASTAAGFRAELDRLDGRQVVIDIITRQSTVLAGTRNVPLGRQHGGPVEAGRPYIVGEVRPELFVPSQSGHIVPSVPAGGGGSVMNLTVNVNAGVGDKYTIASAVAEAVRFYDQTNGRGGR